MLSQLLSDFLFEFLDSVGPVDGLGSLVVIREVFVERVFESTGVEKVIGLHVLSPPSPNLSSLVDLSNAVSTYNTLYLPFYIV
jgi:hypothetical protein